MQLTPRTALLSSVRAPSSSETGTPQTPARPEADLEFSKSTRPLKKSARTGKRERGAQRILNAMLDSGVDSSGNNARLIQQMIINTGDEASKLFEKWQRRRNAALSAAITEFQLGSAVTKEEQDFLNVQAEAKKLALKLRSQRRQRIMQRLAEETRLEGFAGNTGNPASPDLQASGKGTKVLSSIEAAPEVDDQDKSEERSEFSPSSSSSSSTASSSEEEYEMPGIDFAIRADRRKTQMIAPMSRATLTAALAMRRGSITTAPNPKMPMTDPLATAPPSTSTTLPTPQTPRAARGSILHFPGLKRPSILGASPLQSVLAGRSSLASSTSSGRRGVSKEESSIPSRGSVASGLGGVGRPESKDSESQRTISGERERPAFRRYMTMG